MINENDDPNIFVDLINILEKLVPKSDDYLHNEIDDNADAHVKAAILGSGKTMPVDKGKLKLGRWQTVALVEFDGPRERIVNVEIIKG